MGKRWGLLGATVTAGLLLAAGPTSADELRLRLDCSVSVHRHMFSDRFNIPAGRERQSGDAGIWKVEVFLPFPGYEGGVDMTEATPFGIPYFSNELWVEYLNHMDGDADIDEDRIEWCPNRRGRCGVRTPFMRANEGWYEVSKAVIDRRRGTFSVVVTSYIGFLGRTNTDTYHGTCALPPERQF